MPVPNAHNQEDDNGHEDDQDEEEIYDDDDEGPDDLQVDPNSPLYDNSTISYGESNAMVLSLMLNHNLTGSCVADLLQIINFHCPGQGLRRLSYYKFRRFTACNRVRSKKNFYCSNCLTGLENAGAMCNVCNAHRGKSHFVQLSITSQLQSMYKRNLFHHALTQRLAREQPGPDCVADIYDGSVYQEHMGEGGFLTNNNNISLTWYTDGVPVFKSKNYSIWPFMFIINELPYKMRFQRENVLMAGLWFGPQKPSANMFMRSFLPELRRLFDHGVRVRVGDLNRDFITVRALVIAGVCDTPAKSNFLNVAGHSGFYGCPVCEIQGRSLMMTVNEDNEEVVVEAGEGQGGEAGGEGEGEEELEGEGQRRRRNKRYHVFPYQEHLTLRTTARFENAARRALQTGQSVNGVKGPTALRVFMPDFLKGTAVDPMHLVTGVVKKLLMLHFSPECHGKEFSLRLVMAALDAKLKNIKAPKFIHRKPESLEDYHRWKASQLMCWLLYYSIPIYKNNMPLEYYYHYLKFVAAISLLGADTVSTQNILKAERLLKEFVRDFEGLYHLKYCSINIHLLLHLADCVRHLGPLWVFTCFPLENLNGLIVGNIHGKTSVDSQVCNTFWQVVCQHQFLSTVREGEMKDFILKRKRSVKINEQIARGCYSVGDYKRFNGERREIVQLLQASNLNIRNTVIYFRLLKGSMIYACERYERDLASNSSYVAYDRDGQKRFGCVEMFLHVSVCHCPGDCECVHGHFAIIREARKAESIRILYHHNFELPHIRSS
ncbi:hypothetical protein FOCC_FOCC009083 [Frankliniella occidentalis]|nr:hypothetical protein FOCC_FOCC009083 [Frankliniella occidentalis]